VDYLGANVPARDLLELVRQVRPQALAVSMTVPFNLREARDLVGQIRAEAGARAPKILVGGAVFDLDRDLWRRLGADGHASTAAGGLEALERWWQEPGPHDS
jgi:methanogenic corrinoid protein MtbC1